MSLWVIGAGILLGVYSGAKQNRKNLFEQPPYRDMPSIAGKGAGKKYSLIYLRGGTKRYIKRGFIVAFIMILLLSGCLFFRAGHMSFMRQVLPAIWMWYFVRLLTCTLSRPGLAKCPVMVLTANGLWIKEQEEPLLKHVPWDGVKNLTVMNSKGTMVGGVIEKTFSFSPRRIEIDFTDGTVFAADGVAGNIMPIADKFSRWLPVRKVRIE